MKVAYKCPNCGEKKIITMRIWLIILLTLTVIGGIVYLIIFYTKTIKCKKCEVVMLPAVSVGTYKIDK